MRNLLCLLLITNFYQFHTQCFYFWLGTCCVVVVKSKECQLIVYDVLFNKKYKKRYWKFQHSLWKMSMREFFPKKKLQLTSLQTTMSSFKRNFPGIEKQPLGRDGGRGSERKGVLWNFAKLTGKHQRQSFLFDKAAGWELQLC